ncbi:helix-turn-helix domain-containing protein [Salinithrix halophila]|uniref:Tetratricopeptide repeat protein n=1 Tax=Salinithrix halophila TaxID=1485204 RepID=A0ABV8J8I3_9BACL
MATLGINEMGSVIRKVRKERGLRLEDLADDNISPATISNLERGVPTVNPKKAIYLLNKLGIDVDQVPELLMEEKKRLKDMEFLIQLVQLKMEIGQLDEALSMLEQIDVEDKDPYSAVIHYLKGMCFRRKQKIEKAERSLYKGIQVASTKADKSNIEAACFAELSLCTYAYNDMERAISFTDSGIDAFVSDGDHQYIWFALHANKAIYLERLGRVAESMKIVEDIWPSFDKIDNINVFLTFYWLRSELLGRLQLYEDSLRYAIEGLDIARRNQHFSSIATLSTVSGSVYAKIKDFEKAKHYFDVALSCKDHITGRQLTTIYIQLSRLYKEQGKVEDALANAEKAVQNGDKHNDAPRLMEALFVMGDLHFDNKKKNEAIGFYERAWDIARNFSNKEKEYKALFSLAKCWHNVDEKEFHKYMYNMYQVQEQINRLGKEEGDFFDETE